MLLRLEAGEGAIREVASGTGVTGEVVVASGGVSGAVRNC
jgi:hypothetical protein